MFSAAQWIWRSGSGCDEYVQFLCDFTLKTSVPPVMLRYSVDTDCVVFVNGTPVAFGQYPDFPYHKTYEEIDVTDAVTPGKNRLAILAYHCGGTGFMTYYKGAAGLLFEVVRGEKTLAVSGADTLCRLAPDYISGRAEKTTTQLGYRFSYDRRGYDGWTAASYAPVGFLPSVAVEKAPPVAVRPLKKLTAGALAAGDCIKQAWFSWGEGASEGVKQQTAALLPEETPPAAGRYYLFDLGREEVGFFSLHCRAAAGARVSVGYGEHIDDGRVRTAVGGRDFTAVYVCADGAQTFVHPFRRWGARYLQLFVTGACTVLRAGLIPVAYPFAVLPFDAKNGKRQAIYDTAVRTLTLSAHDHYEDCPWREQGLYTMDSRNQMLCGYYAFGAFAPARASLALIAQDARPDGLLSICYPSDCDLAIPSFSLYYILQLHEYLLHTGDAAFVKSVYKKAESVLDVFAARLSNGLIPPFPGKGYWNFYEWADGLSGKTPGAEGAPDLILNALFSYVLAEWKALNAAIGQTPRLPCDRLGGAVNDAITRTFFAEKRGLYETVAGTGHFSELGNALAVLCGAATGARARAVCDALTANDMVKATLSMVTFKYDALLAVDKDAYAAYILGDIDKDYGYMLDCGATSFWETINGASDFANAGSLCHGWSAMPVYYYRLLIK
jgi:hypothetical protein